MIDLKNLNIILTGATGVIGNAILDKLILGGLCKQSVPYLQLILIDFVIHQLCLLKLLVVWQIVP